MIEIALFPYSKLYMEMYRDLCIMEISEKYLENYEYYSSVGIADPYFTESGCNYILEDAADKASDFVSNTVIWIKKTWKKFVGVFTSAQQKIAEADKKYQEGFSKEEGGKVIDTVEGTTRKMIRKEHQWTSKEIEDFIKGARSGSIGHWAKLKISLNDPDVQNLQFYPNVSDKYKAAFKNIITFMLCRDNNATVRIKDLVSEESKSPLVGMLSGGKKILAGPGGVFSLFAVAKMVEKIGIECEKSENDESVEALYAEFEKSQQDINDCVIAKRDEKLAQNLKDINNRIETLKAEINADPNKADEHAEELRKLNKSAVASVKQHRKAKSAASRKKLFSMLSTLGLTVSAAMGATSIVSNTAAALGAGAKGALRAVIE